jgi:rRNA maturation endonuclease Nob1
MGCRCGSQRIFQFKDLDVCADCGRETSRFPDVLKKVFPKNAVCRNCGHEMAYKLMKHTDKVGVTHFIRPKFHVVGEKLETKCSCGCIKPEFKKMV